MIRNEREKESTDSLYRLRATPPRRRLAASGEKGSGLGVVVGRRLHPPRWRGSPHNGNVAIPWWPSTRLPPGDTTTTTEMDTKARHDGRMGW